MTRIDTGVEHATECWLCGDDHFADEECSFRKGLRNAVLISLGMWAVIVWGVL
jgi:hypothetical protein